MRATFLSCTLLCALGAGDVSAQSSPAALEAVARQRAARQQQEAPTAPSAFGVPNQEKAREAAELVYNTWRLAMIRGSEQAWRSSATRSRQVKVRNLIISQRGSFPRDFFNTQAEPPKLENFKFVGAITACGGRTLAATYVGRLQLGEGQARDNAFVLEMVYEDGKWKLDQTRFFDLSHLPDVRKRLLSKDIELLKEQDGFQPYAALPRVPAACQPPVLIGKIFVDCPGRDLDISINGMSEHEFTDERRADVISGGLRRGQNTIRYTVRTNEALPHPTMGIGIFVMPETPGNHPVCVFDHIIDESGTATGGTITFNISNEHIASMNPNFKGEAPGPHHAVPLKPKAEAPKK